VAALPERLREVLVLKHFGKLSFSEVAIATGLPLGTVKSRMQAAFVQLRVELRRLGITESE
jgi:RNA polymerase sigma-70 factor (ECF subfamily)